MDTLDNILEYNKKFVKNEGYKNFITSKFPDKKIVILTCMDTRLTKLLPEALGLNNGDVKMIKNAGGVVVHPFASTMRSILITIYEFDVKDVLIIGHDHCGMASVDKSYVLDKMLERGIKQETLDTIRNSGINLNEVLQGFEDVNESVLNSVNLVQNHPLVPDDVRVTGMVINPETGALRYAK
ncbi:hypothetical protein AZF37_03045 [endosymbiont 'TC1' of Trimyema compressum]|uniref:beta-class carbonic anhydrase n=1 Tax=endosymbiont 'TC1' of Trimyema compressum TaxID=243899 RepID=UPI0007F05FD4|nr:carbonic anhydrase [endosymbiont 'TC1' of Trimyema compressum]AMP20282.1 hypothetical protein AZF37_03045 [endosymbiont 'TC1' of Trimyema compressum]